MFNPRMEIRLSGLAITGVVGAVCYALGLDAGWSAAIALGGAPAILLTLLGACFVLACYDQTLQRWSSRERRGF